MNPVHVVGLGMSPDDLTAAALDLINQAQVLVGGRRLLDYFPDHPAEKIILGKDPAGTLAQLPALAAGRRTVVLASGDPNFYGVAPLVVQTLGPERVIIHPNLTAVQAACARLKLSWQDAQVVSLHGRAWDNLDAALGRNGKIIIYTDPEHPPAAIARFLRNRDLLQARFCVLEDLGQDTERLTWLRPEEAETRQFSPLNLVVVLREQSPARSRLHLGLPEDELAHQRGLVTKAEVRAVVLARLRLYPGLTLWDVGAGCGSVGLEASLLLPGGRILAIEQDPERAAQIRTNREKFGVSHLEVICGRAPECLAALPPPQRVFIGGGGRDVADILQEALERLETGGRIVLTAALLETLETARQVLSATGWEAEVTQLQVSRSRPLSGGTYLQALNPVWIVTGWRGSNYD
jgi:precorrin-6B C5,15-methyltransferase / cobalt-precorrin-6B C5,C15-methyltransferase